MKKYANETPYDGGSAKQLTPQQMKFATLLVYGVEGNPVTKTEAARRAGYTDKGHWCSVAGSELTNPNKYPLVCAYISNMRDEVRQKYGISYEAHLEELGKIRDMGKKDSRNLAAAATTEIARGKVGGYYIDQKIVRHGKIDDMNLSQLYDKMRTIRVKNERMEKARESLNKVTGESALQNKDKPVKQLPSSHKTNDQDSTS
jgi:phage terminase small subunit